MSEVTRILAAIERADADAANELLPLVYDQLKREAQRRMASERPDHTLQATALMHEAYLRLLGDEKIPWQNRAHFFAAAAEAMRRVLIENNRRRIQLLEQAARLLYKEWFVHLRFPGHEHVNITDGIPEEWKRLALADLAESIDYGYTASANREPVGPKFLRITDIVGAIVDWSSVPHCHIPNEKLTKFGLSEGDIVIARTGATVGYAKRITRLHPAAVFASYLVRLRIGERSDDVLVGIYVESDQYKAYVRSCVGGAAQPNANARVLAAAPFLNPPLTLRRAFREIVEPMYSQRELLQHQSGKLREARDLLLPRLMNGEIAA